MVVRSTTGGPIFVSPDKPRGDVTDVTDVSNVTVWSTRHHGGPWFIKFMVYGVHKPGILK